MQLTKHLHLPVPVDTAALLHGEFSLPDLESVIVLAALPAVEVCELLSHFGFVERVDSFCLAHSFKALKRWFEKGRSG